MNANEVIANRANELLGRPLGSREPVHPHDHVNLSQSSNDSFPTVMNVAALLACESRLIPALVRLRSSLECRSDAFRGALRTVHPPLHDPAQWRLGQAFNGYAHP